LIACGGEPHFGNLVVKDIVRMDAFPAQISFPLVDIYSNSDAPSPVFAREKEIALESLVATRMVVSAVEWYPAGPARTLRG